MKLKIIGSSIMWSKGNQASYLIDDRILIDIPNGCLKDLRRYNILPTSINNILITHMHGDHYFDIPFYLLNKLKDPSNLINISLPKNGIRKIRNLVYLAFPYSTYNIFHKLNINFITKNNFNIDKYNITKLKMNHGYLKQSYGYIIDDGKSKIGFTGDSSICPNIEYMCSIVDYIVVDSTYLNGNNIHMGLDNIYNLASIYKDTIFILSHSSDKVKNTKIEIDNIIIPNDGDEYNI